MGIGSDVRLTSGVSEVCEGVGIEIDAISSGEGWSNVSLLKGTAANSTKLKQVLLNFVIFDNNV